MSTSNRKFNKLSKGKTPTPFSLRLTFEERAKLEEAAKATKYYVVGGNYTSTHGYSKKSNVMIKYYQKYFNILGNKRIYAQLFQK